MSKEMTMVLTRRRSREIIIITSHVAFSPQWAEQYNMDNPVNLKEFPRVEFWTDTNWEPYKEGIQQEIRRQLTTDGKDFAEVIKPLST